MMTETDNLVLEHLRYMRSKIDRVEKQNAEIIQRLSTIEQHNAAFHSSSAQNSRRIDEMDTRLDQIEKRLELKDT